jgi:Cft2 family RNA processing exonuclease
MELYIAGGCSEHGRNCFLVRGRKVSFLVDAGVMKEKPDHPYPELTAEQVREAQYLFLTHCHNDHAGALPHLRELGFCGKVFASRPTLTILGRMITQGYALEDFSQALSETQLDGSLHVTWGRSGHCAGSLWFEFRAEDRVILFTGDYEEHSAAYTADEIRGREADLAVIDSAYGMDDLTAEEHRRRAEGAVENLLFSSVPALFPVPSHGRGFDILHYLLKRGIPSYVPLPILRELSQMPGRSFYLKESFLSGLHDELIRPLPELLNRNGEERKAFMGQRCAVLVQDSQLYQKASLDLAEEVLALGGRVILTGKQDPKSHARRLLDEGRAEFFRIPVHQNVEDMLKLRRENSFGLVVPYHCRQTLSFAERDLLVLKPQDRVNF